MNTKVNIALLTVALIFAHADNPVQTPYGSA